MGRSLRTAWIACSSVLLTLLFWFVLLDMKNLPGHWPSAAQLDHMGGFCYALTATLRAVSGPPRSPCWPLDFSLEWLLAVFFFFPFASPVVPHTWHPANDSW